MRSADSERMIGQEYLPTCWGIVRTHQVKFKDFAEVEISATPACEGGGYPALSLTVRATAAQGLRLAAPACTQPHPDMLGLSESHQAFPSEFAPKP